MLLDLVRFGLHVVCMLVRFDRKNLEIQFGGFKEMVQVLFDNWTCLKDPSFNNAEIADQTQAPTIARPQNR